MKAKDKVEKSKAHREAARGRESVGRHGWEMIAKEDKTPAHKSC